MKIASGLIAACLTLFAAGPAFAGFDRWTSEIEDDPFDNRGRLILTNMDSIRSGMLILCEEKSDEIVVRWASPYNFDQAAPPDVPSVPLSLAFDFGERFDTDALLRQLGSNTIGFDAPFTGARAKLVLESFAQARSKIYVKVGNGDPNQFTARGSTASANKALGYCFAD